MVSCRRFAALLGALILAANLDVVFGTHSFFYRDFGLFGYPNALLKQSLWRGGSLWNPLSNCGLPFLAQWNTMALCLLAFMCCCRCPGRSAFSIWRICFSPVSECMLLARRWTQNELAAGLAGAAFAFNGLTSKSHVAQQHRGVWMDAVGGVVRRTRVERRKKKVAGLRRRDCAAIVGRCSGDHWSDLVRRRRIMGGNTLEK
jgi:hypothetical protein